MRNLILKMSISVDGFVGGPNGEIDWLFRSMSDEGREWTTELLESAGLHALGRKSYSEMATFWPLSPMPMARLMNEIPKAVFSRSGKVATPEIDESKATQIALDTWRNPIVLGTDLVADIQRLKEEDGKPILAHGGAGFATSLIAANLVDVFHLVVHPDAIGKGLSIFGGLEKPMQLKLEDLKQFDTGVVVKTYRPL